MTLAEKHIVNTYSSLFEGLSISSKIELLEKLISSLKKSQKDKDEDFFSAFGAFGSKKSADEIVANIKESRKFVDKDLKL